MVIVEGMIDVACYPNRAFRLLTNIGQYPLWQKDIQSCQILTPHKTGIGTQYQKKVRFLDRTITATFEFTKFVPNRYLQVNSTDGPFNQSTSWEIIQRPGSSIIRTISTIFSETGLEIAEPLLKWMLQQSISEDHKQLKRLLERDPLQVVMPTMRRSAQLVSL